MPYAAIEDNKVIALSCSKDEVLLYKHTKIVKISDILYRAIMYGIEPLNSIIEDIKDTTDTLDILNYQTIADSTIYPCMMPMIDKVAMVKLAKLIPHNSIAVEIGSRLGGSAKLLTDYTTTPIHLYCIDLEWLWGTEFNSIVNDDAMERLRTQNPDILNFESSYDYAKHLLSGYNNVTLLPGASPYDFTEWKGDVDFVFEDSGHENPQLKDNLDFWWGKLQPGGIMAGHDYSINWPDVVQEVDRLANTNGCKLNTYGTVWWMIK